MKIRKIAYLVAIIALLLAIGVLNRPETTATPEPTSTPQPTPLIIASNFNDKDIIIQEEVYTDTSFEKCDVSIKYPVITISGQNTSYVNYIIHDFAMSIIHLDSDRTGVTLYITYEITLKNNKMISILFKGYYHYEKMPHGENINRALSIDLTKSKHMILEMNCGINEEFVDLYINNTKEQLKEETDEKYDYMDVFDSFYFSSGYPEVYNVDLVPGMSAYYTEDAIYITRDVVYALGSYYETKIAYEELLPFIKTDSLLYEILMNRN